MKTALVMGAGGFIGSHMVKRLKAEGFWVRGVDLKSPEFSETETDDFVVGDLRDPEIVSNTIDKDIDELYQFAADMGGAGFVFTGENDADIMHNSGLINLNVVMECVKKNVKKIFYKGEPKTAEWLEKRKIELTRQGKNWEKELKKTGLKLEYHPSKMNPRFEFEERVLGNLPTKDIKLMDWAKIPIAHGTKLAQGVVSKYGEVAPTRELHSLIKSIMNIDKASPQLPLIMSEQVRGTLKKVQPYLTNVYTQHGQPDKLKALEKLMSAPTYKYNPFKLRNR